MKIEVPRAVRLPAVGRDGHFVRRVRRSCRRRLFSAPGSSALVGVLVPARDQNRYGIVGVTRT